MPEENSNPAPKTAASANVAQPSAPAAANAAPQPTTEPTEAQPAAEPAATTTAQPTPTPEPTTPEPATTQQPADTPEPAAPENPIPEPTTAETLKDEAPTPMSSPIMKSIVRKPKNKLFPIVLILALLTLAGIGTSVYFGIQNSNQASEIVQLKNKLASQVPITPDNPDDEPSADEDDQKEPEITAEIRAKVLATVPGNLILSDAKSMNTGSEMVYGIGASLDATNPAFTTQLDLSTNQATLTINWDRVKEIYALATDKTGSENVSDLGLSGKPTDLLLTGFGQATGYETLFFLMENGTVEYIPLAKAAKSGNFKSHGKLPDVSNVIKFYSGSSCSKTGPGCGMQSLAQRADGNFYELYEAVKTTGGFDL